MQFIETNKQKKILILVASFNLRIKIKTKQHNCENRVNCEIQLNNTVTLSKMKSHC